jgi:hypothetical protein
MRCQGSAACGWRDPDSNRGHHDFRQMSARLDQAPKCLQIALYLYTCYTWLLFECAGVAQLARGVCLIRTRQGSRVLIDPLRASNNNGVAAPLAIAFRRKRAWLQLVAQRSLLVPSRRLVGVAGDDRIKRSSSA